MKDYKVIEKISKEIDYNSRNWNKEKIDRYLFKYDENRIIESMTIIHLKDNHTRDLTVEISNMYNCIVGCRFCASGSLPESRVFLSAEDYLAQVETCLVESNINPNNYPNFYIAFTGVGEPSIVKEEVSKGIELIRAKYKHVQINIATTGFDNSCFKYWSDLNLPIRTIQLPFYSCEEEKIRYIITNLPKNYDLLKNIEEAIKYKNNHNLCRIKINYVVINNFNNTENDVEKMIQYLSPFKEDIVIKVSYLNYTKKCKENNLSSPSTEVMINILERLKLENFDCYLFGTENNTELGCGQLIQNFISES